MLENETLCSSGYKKASERIILYVLFFPFFLSHFLSRFQLRKQNFNKILATVKYVFNKSQIQNYCSNIIIKEVWIVYRLFLVILSLFIDFKSIQVISGFNLKRMKNIGRWHCSTKISKTNLKSIKSPLLTLPQGCQGCQKIQNTKLKTTLVSWSAKIWPNLNKVWKTFRKQGFFDNFC